MTVEDKQAPIMNYHKNVLSAKANKLIKQNEGANSSNYFRNRE